MHPLKQRVNHIEVDLTNFSLAYSWPRLSISEQNCQAMVKQWNRVSEASLCFGPDICARIGATEAKGRDTRIASVRAEIQELSLVFGAKRQSSTLDRNLLKAQKYVETRHRNLAGITIHVDMRVEAVEMNVRRNTVMVQHQDALHKTCK